MISVGVDYSAVPKERLLGLTRVVREVCSQSPRVSVLMYDVPEFIVSAETEEVISKFLVDLFGKVKYLFLMTPVKTGIVHLK